MARDPRDAAVSRMLYRWHGGHKGQKKQYEAHLDLVFKKEKNPLSVAFSEICSYTGHDGYPRTADQVIEEERNRYDQMLKFVTELGSDWFFLTFENMVEKKLNPLNDYLGFKVQADAEVPSSSGKAKVIRKKASGDWRHWFTEADITLFKPSFTPYMEFIGYDCENWDLASNPVIEPEYSSGYMQNLVRKATKNSLLRYMDPVIQRFVKRS
jgi:hypothetical protein